MTMSLISGDTETTKEKYVRDGDTYVTSVLLLCAECQQPIKATITTERWIKCEWIGPSGECQPCAQLKRREKEEGGG